MDGHTDMAQSTDDADLKYIFISDSFHLLLIFHIPIKFDYIYGYKFNEALYQILVFAVSILSNILTFIWMNMYVSN